ncbi:hypothetical protein CYMTET_47208 [Cymbomonas tetramitiformis]|uniref:nicotinate-nucleotide diphosphorylase (carboxylating) n=1 Tax=Cymbomonas tetramitiformis TaxID=36881 RepID=A0AAE0EW78_9CHLO|nr:hypothetical protein CYMTET_47208 [Cymbomonas tetramitiformis]
MTWTLHPVPAPVTSLSLTRQTTVSSCKPLSLVSRVRARSIQPRSSDLRLLKTSFQPFHFSLKRTAHITAMATSDPCTVPPPAHPDYSIEQVIDLALTEDAGDIGDITSLATIPPDDQGVASFLAKADGVLAGAAVANMVFQAVDPELKAEWAVVDGAEITKGMRIGEVRGSVHSLLRAERVALNFMQRMSGVATATKRMADAAQPARILETRKTVPGLRLLDKWSVLIVAARTTAWVLTRACKYLAERNLALPIEVETRTMDEVREVVQVMDAMGDDERSRIVRVMLDNMSLEQMTEAVGIIGGRCDTEASGNVTMETVNAIGQTGVTYISSGALTHSVIALDISMNIE